MLRKANEQEMAIRFYKNLVCSTSFDCTYYFENQDGKYPPKNKIFLTNILVSSSINLPEVFKTQTELGFFVACANRNEIKMGFIFGFQRQFTLPLIKMIDLKVIKLFFIYFKKKKKVNFAYNNQKNTIGLLINKTTDYGFYFFIKTY